MTEFWGNQKLHADFWLDEGRHPKAPCCSKVNCIWPLYKPIAVQVASSNWRILDHPWQSGADSDLITGTHECLIRPLLITVHPASLLCTWEDAKVAETPVFWLKPCIYLKSTFWAFCNLLLPIQHFKNHPRRLWLPTPKECLLFTIKTIEVFREQYIINLYNRGRELLEVKLWWPKKKQPKYLSYCWEQRKSLST